MGSSRLPGKVLRPLGGRPVLGWVIRAAREALPTDDVVVATTRQQQDDAVADIALAAGAHVCRGAVDDVLSRFVTAADGHTDDDTLIRLTADCPFLDPAIIRTCAQAFEGLDVDYLSTNHPRSLPRGLDVEVLTVGVLRELDATSTGVDRIHVTSGLYRAGSRRRAGLTFHPPADDLRVTLDTSEDLAALEAVASELGDAPPSWSSVVELLRGRPDIVAMNASVRQKHVDEG